MYYIVFVVTAVVIAASPQYPSTSQSIVSLIHHPLCNTVIPLSVIVSHIHCHAITFFICSVSLPCAHWLVYRENS
jgi:hypothetical protein